MRRLRTFSQFSSWRYVVTLDGTDYLLRLRWHERCGSWYVDIFEPGGTPIVVGTKAVIGWPLFQGHKDLRLPPGLLMLFYLDGEGQEADTQASLGDTHSLVYVAREDLPAAPESEYGITIS